MKLLLVTWYFPPSRTIAAVRLGKLARYLLAQGHDVRVLTPLDPPLPQDLDVEFPAEQVVRTAWHPNVKGTKSSRRPAPAAVGTVPAGGVGKPSMLKRNLWRLHSSFSEFPDPRAPWLPFAAEAGAKLFAEWQPDLVFASGPPFTTLLAGQELSDKFAVPLVLEFRDRWSEDPYSPPFFWRRWRNRLAEDELIRNARALVTVSEPWAEAYRARYGKPTAVIYNGYDAEFCGDGPFDGAAGREGLEIVYTGGIYPGYRDPSPLFAAMKQLDEKGLSCRMIFHGVRPATVAPLAEAQGVSHLVEVREVLAHEEALRRQRESDILVLLQWNDPKEQGNVPGKFFEYLGARRPILVLGLHDGVPATIVKERGAGFFSNESDAIAKQLVRWLEIKKEKGLLPPVPEAGRAGFSRDEQYARLEKFLEDLIAGGPVRGRAPGSEALIQTG
ncbi:MAG: glycosyltransferase [Kiloniellaceae bacterium]